MEQYKKEKMSIAYVDESGFAKDMRRTHGYSQRGERCFGSHDWNAKGRENVIGALLGANLIACGIVSSNIDIDVFNT